MKPGSSSAFTLGEVITVIAVCVILAGLVILISPYSTKRRPGRVQAEIAMLSAACESYKADFGAYPEDLSAEQSTNMLKPRKHFKPTNREYQPARTGRYSGEERTEVS